VRVLHSLVVKGCALRHHAHVDLCKKVPTRLDVLTLLVAGHNLSMKEDLQRRIHDDPRDLADVGADGLLDTLPVPMARQHACPLATAGLDLVDAALYILSVERGDEAHPVVVVGVHIVRLKEWGALDGCCPLADARLQAVASEHGVVHLFGLGWLLRQQFQRESARGGIGMLVVHGCGHRGRDARASLFVTPAHSQPLRAAVSRLRYLSMSVHVVLLTLWTVFVGCCVVSL
jgi:hypothetical protein